MKKAKYYFNTHTLRYEKIVVSIRKRLFRVLGFIATALVFGTLIVVLAYSYIDSPKEKQLKAELEQMRLQYEILNKRTARSERILADLQQRDENIYRVVFEAEPIPLSIRRAGFGGLNRYAHLEGSNNAELLINSSNKIDQLEKQLYLQSKSMDEIFSLAKGKSQMLASIPAIQPVANKDLTRVASGFGYRIHPIYKTRMMHTGIDFTAPSGTEIYATGNGVVKKIEYAGRGYGNSVIISHGYGYETLYGHMSKITVKQGKRINRGDVIGYVGNTGTSTAPHLHYEVIKGGNKINPINFFYNDLSPEEFEKVIEIASQSNQSFD
ncbi:MAG TPA: M23 family metallopeptidase [Bacteroidia bacterium]|nr:M23 family metallopeptidase [Bacteroidia bacterium]